MKRLLFITLTLLVAGGLCAAVLNTAHDLSTGSTGGFLTAGLPDTTVTAVCVFCHTPHQATAANGQYPLWNHTLSATAAYGTYSSSTLDASDVTDIGGATAGSASVSNLCMSCHDGTVAVGSLWNDQNNPAGGEFTPSTNATMIGANVRNLGTDLTDDHPVNFTYDAALATADGELVTPTSASCVDAACNVPLFTSKVQCASCHDPHDNTNGAFLTVSQADSALCTTCHVK